jgi:hypothetical protein
LTEMAPMSTPTLDGCDMLSGEGVFCFASGSFNRSLMDITFMQSSIKSSIAPIYEVPIIKLWERWFILCLLIF